MQHDILLPFSDGCLTGRFLERRRRFSVALSTDQGHIWIHSNNTGSMLGLTRPGALVLASKSPNPRTEASLYPGGRALRRPSRRRTRLLGRSKYLRSQPDD